MRIIKRDITTIRSGVLVNGVNCQRAMGSGVAKAYMEKWPRVYRQYVSWDKADMHLGLVDFVLVEWPYEVYVANCWTQEYYGRDGKRYASTAHIAMCLAHVVEFGIARSLPVYTPWVGCGLGGVSQGEVRQIIEDVERQYNTTITVCEID